MLRIYSVNKEVTELPLFSKNSAKPKNKIKIFLGAMTVNNARDFHSQFSCDVEA